MGAVQQLASAWHDTRHTVANRLFLDRQAEFWLRALDPVASLSEIRARVVDVVHETADARTFVLRPNRHWRGHHAGQWTRVEVEIDGARTHRCYSISSAPGAELVSITVKRVPGGRVSGWLHDHVRPGHVLGLSEARGDFVLPAEPAPRLLLLAGGSGITPMMSMLRALAARDALGDVVLVHHARRLDDVIFRDAIDALATAHPGLRRVWCLDDDPRGKGGFDEELLVETVPDLAEREAFVCGPPALMARVEAMWRATGHEHRLHVERFTVPSPLPVLESPGEPAARDVAVHLARSGRTLPVHTAGTLLEQLERAGERPPSGCRMGICRSCTCVKRAGTVRNALTGAISSAPDEPIQLCVSTPCTDVELSL